MMKAIECKLDLNQMTVTGKTVGENLADVELVENDVIFPMEHPKRPEGGLAILHGNLAVEGAFGIDYHNRAESAKSETSGLYDLYLIFKSCGLKLHFQSLCKLNASR